MCDKCLAKYFKPDPREVAGYAQQFPVIGAINGPQVLYMSSASLMSAFFGTMAQNGVSRDVLIAACEELIDCAYIKHNANVDPAAAKVASEQLFSKVMKDKKK